LSTFEKILDLLMLLSGFLGLICVGVILLSSKSKKFINSFLVLIFLITAVQLIAKSTYNLKIQADIKDLTKSFRLLLLLKLPLFYLYVYTLTLNLKKLKRIQYFHLLTPFALMFLHKAVSVNEQIQINTYKYALTFVILIYFVFYLIKIIHVLKNFWEIQPKTATKQSKTLYNWVNIVVFFFILFFIRLIIGLSFELFFNRIIDGNSSNYIASIIWLGLFIKLFLSPEILYGFTFPDAEPKKQIDPSTDFNENWQFEPSTIQNLNDIKLSEKISEDMQVFILELDKTVLETNFFQDPNASTKTLATTLNRPSSHLVFIFKYYSTIGFSEYRNKMRIEHAKKLIKNNFLVSNTLEALSIKVGFSSYNPFYSAFKKQTGVSPNEFSKNKTA
jgi:AraC-like DNA-binding protein